MRLLLAEVLLVFWTTPLAPVAAPAQEQPTDEGFGEALEVTEVLLDVLVTDKNDQVILGLGAEDFEVLEDGEPVEITSAIFYSNRLLMEFSERASRRDVAIDMVPRDRFFILFFQDQRHGSTQTSMFRRQMEAARDLSHWLMEEALLEDRIAVVSYGRKLTVHQDFTTDREALLQAIDGAARGRDPADLPPSRRREVEVDPPALGSLPAGRELRKASKDIYHALRLVAEAVSGVPGRKNLLFLGRGFGEIGTFGMYEPEFHKLNPTLNSLNDANVAAYTIDITPASVRYNLEGSLSNLASATGGRSFDRLLNFTRPLKQISDLTNGYYLLSYQSHRPRNQSGYQRVDVATRNPELRIQARQGYLYGSEHKP